MKISHWLFIAGGSVLVLDLYAQSTVSKPIASLDPVVGRVRSLYAPLDDKLPIPLWLALVASGAVLRFGFGK